MLGAANAAKDPGEDFCRLFAHDKSTPSRMFVIAIHDDTFFVGPPAEVATAFSFCRSEVGYKSIGKNMRLNASKSVVFAPALDSEDPRSL